MPTPLAKRSTRLWGAGTGDEARPHGFQVVQWCSQTMENRWAQRQEAELRHTLVTLDTTLPLSEPQVPSASNTAQIWFL